MPRRLQQPALLSLRLLALLLLIFGLAHPLITRARPTGKLTVLLLDASFSMRAGNRAVAAVEQARQAVTRMGAGERVAIVEFDREARILSGVTSDRTAALDSLKLYQPRNGSADYVQALKTAARLIRAEGAANAAVLLISDFQDAGLLNEERLARSASETALVITTIAVGAPLRKNVYWADVAADTKKGVTQISATESISTPEGVAAIRRNWELRTPDGKEPGISWHTEAAGGINGELRSEASDDLVADNTHAFVVVPSRPRGVLLIADGTDATTYLRAALGAATEAEPDESTSMPATEELEQYQLVVMVMRDQPDAATMTALNDFAARGGTVWLLAGAELIADAWNAWLGSAPGAKSGLVSLSKLEGAAKPRLSVTDPTAAAVSELSSADRSRLMGIPVLAGYALTPGPKASVVMRWSNGSPAMLETNPGAGRTIILATSPARESGGLGLSGVFPQLAASVAAISASASIDDSANPPVAESEIALTDPALVKQIFEGQGQPLSATNTMPPSTNDGPWWRYLIGLASMILLVELWLSLKRTVQPAEPGNSPSPQ
jgi:hypothetical protein